MKHLLDRETFLSQHVNEGFGDFVKKGFNKLKNMFSFLIKKVKNFIAVFDNDGNVLPVISLQAVIDHFSNTNGVEVYAPKEISNSVVDAGGEGCGDNPKLLNDDESYGDVSEDSIEYKNFMSLTKILRENFDVEVTDMSELNERSSYSKPGEKLNVPIIDTTEFEKLLKQRIIDRQKRRRKGNLLIFGAPGIGKSSIANTVIKEYNKMKSASESVSLITVNCANLSPGDFMMPTIPIKRDIDGFMRRHKDDIPAIASMDNLSEDEQLELSSSLRQQKVSDSAPKTWLPCYKPTDNELINEVLDAAANGTISKDKNNPKNNKETGSGGIILFDELFRADPAIFNQLMTFLLTREMDGWVLGSKWTIVACSNRPADSKRVSMTWENVEGADLDRYCQIALLQPSVEGWKNYMRGLGLTGENEIIFKFIFDPDSKDGDEYPRWHRVDNKEDLESDTTSGNEKSSANTIPVTPRRWEEVWKEIQDYMEDEGYKSILEIPLNDLNDIVKLYFTPDFLNEFIDWLQAHTGNVDIYQVMEDPTNTFPSKSTKTDDVVIIRDLWEQFEKAFGKKGDCPDEDLANIFIWFGINFPNEVNLINNDFYQNLDKVLTKDGSKLHDKTKALNVLHAAYPEREDFEGNGDDYDGLEPEQIEIIKQLMREYFPWRLKGDEIQYIDDYID